MAFSHCAPLAPERPGILKVNSCVNFADSKLKLLKLKGPLYKTPTSAQGRVEDHRRRLNRSPTQVLRSGEPGSSETDGASLKVQGLLYLVSKLRSFWRRHSGVLRSSPRGVDTKAVDLPPNPSGAVLEELQCQLPLLCLIPKRWGTTAEVLESSNGSSSSMAAKDCGITQLDSKGPSRTRSPPRPRCGRWALGDGGGGLSPDPFCRHWELSKAERLETKISSVRTAVHAAAQHLQSQRPSRRLVADAHHPWLGHEFRPTHRSMCLSAGCDLHSKNHGAVDNAWTGSLFGGGPTKVVVNEQ